MKFLTLLGSLKKYIPVKFAVIFFAIYGIIEFFKPNNMDEDHVEREFHLAEEMEIDLALNADFLDDDEEEEMEDDDDDNFDGSSADSDDDYDENLSSYRFDISNNEKSILNKKPPYSFKPLCLIKCDSIESKENGEDSLPIARSGHRVIASDSHLYSLGGYNPRNALTAARLGSCLLFQELWSYNFATHRWKLVTGPRKGVDMPTELASIALTIYKNVLISHGGTGYPFGEVCSNDCYVYTTGSENAIVSRLSVSGDLPLAQYGPTIVIHDDYLYTIGGTTGFDYSCDVYRLNLKTKKWENLYNCRPEMREDPEGRYRHEVVYDDDFIYILGGGTSNSVYDLDRIPAFNLTKHTWVYFQTLPDQSVINEEANNPNDPARGYPKPRKCFSCVQHTLCNGDIEAFIAGGLQHFNLQSEFNTYFSDVWKLNLRTKQWTLIRTAKLPKPLYFHSAAHASNGCMYIFGGIIYTANEVKRRRDLYKMWMTIPRLSEICWDAITYYNPNLHYKSRDKLLKAGIPLRFVERLPPQPAILSTSPKTSPGNQ